MKIVSTIVGTIVLVVGVLFMLSFLMAFPMMWMWNYSIVPTIDGVHPLTYWRAYWMMWFLGLYVAGSSSSSSSK